MSITAVNHPVYVITAEYNHFIIFTASQVENEEQKEQQLEWS